MRITVSCMLIAAAVILVGCGKPKSATNSAAAPNAPAPTRGSSEAEPGAGASTALAPTELKKVDASGFTLDGYLPPLDGGRIELAPPADWTPLPRDSEYVVRFYKDSKNGLPRLEVIVEENNVGGLTDLSEATVTEFTAAVAKEMEASGVTVIEAPVPMVIGSVPCARIVSKLKLKIGAGTILVERQTLALLHAGRLYKINLLVEANKLGESKDAAYAVCSGVRFPAAETPDS